MDAWMKYAMPLLGALIIVAALFMEENRTIFIALGVIFLAVGATGLSRKRK